MDDDDLLSTLIHHLAYLKRFSAKQEEQKLDMTNSEITPGFDKLLKEPAYCEIGTLMPDGSPQVTQVWVDTDGQHILINTSENRQKSHNVRRDPRVAVNVFDPSNPWRIASVRGRVADITTDGADEHIDRLSYKYTGNENINSTNLEKCASFSKSFPRRSTQSVSNSPAA